MPQNYADNLQDDWHFHNHTQSRAARRDGGKFLELVLSDNLSSMRHSLIIKPSLKLYLSNKYQLLKWEISHFIINNQNLLTMKWESSGDC
jgi:hypothetical protein